MVTGIGAGITQELVWLYSVHSFASANGVTLVQLVAGSFIELSDYDRCFWFRIRYFAGICHVVPECSAVPDVHPYSYQGKIFRDLLRIGRIVYGCR